MERCLQILEENAKILRVECCIGSIFRQTGAQKYKTFQTNDGNKGYSFSVDKGVSTKGPSFPWGSGIRSFGAFVCEAEFGYGQLG